MGEPIVFISTHRIKEGKLDAFREYFRSGTPSIEADKPQTVAFNAFLDEAGAEVTIVHVFPDSRAMDRHFEGAEKRSKRAYDFLEPKSFEVYGSASEEALDMLRQATELGVDLTVKPENIGGFLRLSSPVSDAGTT